MFRILAVAHRIEPARAPSLLVAVLLVLLVARDASNDMVASLVESPRAGLVFQLVLMLLAFTAWFFARAALCLRDGIAFRERPRRGEPIGHALWLWWPRLLFAAVAAIGATVSLRSAALLQATICVCWAGFGVALLHRRGRHFPEATPRRIGWHEAVPFGWPGFVVGGLAVLGGAGVFVLAACLGYGWLHGLDLAALLSAVAPRDGAAVLCLLLILPPLTVATMLADRFPLRHGGWRVPMLCVLAALLVAGPQVAPLHQVRTATQPGLAVDARVGLRPIVAATLGACTAPDQPVRPIVVALSGGASRAALWSARVLRDVDEAAASSGDVVLAVSSVSGGSLGAAAYLALRRDDADAGEPCHLRLSDAREATIIDRLRRDMLGPLLVGTLLEDTARAVLAPVVRLFGPDAIPRGGDRAEALERGFSRAWGHPEGAPGWHGFEENFLSFFYDRDGAWRPGLPIWISNGTDVRNGRRLLTSPVAVPAMRRVSGVVEDGDWPFWGAGDVLSLLGADVPLSTAIHDSARFPLLSPTGAVMPLVPDRDLASPGYGREPPQIVDGGYFENSGLTTAVELASWLRAQRFEGRPIDPILVLVTADAEPATGADEVPRCLSGPSFAPNAIGLGHEVPQLLAPVATLFATRGGHANYAVERARHAFCSATRDPAAVRFFHFYLHAPPGGAPIPLNWTLSRRTAAAIWQGMRDDNRAELAALRTALAAPASNMEAADATAPRLARRNADGDRTW